MRHLGLAFVLAVCSLGCGEDEDLAQGLSSTGGSGGTGGNGGTGATSSSSLVAQGSVEQVYVTHAAAGAELELVDAGGTAVQSGSADTQGSLIFREVTPGSGYVVRT